MVPKTLIKRVLADVRAHCQSKGYQESPGVNNFVPHDCVAAFAMAKALGRSGRYEHYIAIAPEGHIYSYFFERLGLNILSVFTDFPPTRCESGGALDVIKSGRVLLIEDDVIGGATLRLVVKFLSEHEPRSLELYLGHTKGIQHLNNVPPEVSAVHLAEDRLNRDRRDEYEREFVDFFEQIIDEER